VLTVKASAATLLEILNDILDFSKIESRCLELEHVPFVHPTSSTRRSSRWRSRRTRRASQPRHLPALLRKSRGDRGVQEGEHLEIQN
jgi:signal transduction histidine kinase